VAAFVRQAAAEGSIGNAAAAAAYKDTEDKTASGASKADMVFAQIR
jgi:hypothetical protein